MGFGMWDTNPLLLPLRPLLLLLLRVDSDGRDLVAENRLKLLFLRELCARNRTKDEREWKEKERKREKKNRTNCSRSRGGGGSRGRGSLDGERLAVLDGVLHGRVEPLLGDVLGLHELADLLVAGGVGLGELGGRPLGKPDLARVVVANALQLLDLLRLERGHGNHLDAVPKLAAGAAHSR